MLKTIRKSGKLRFDPIFGQFLRSLMVEYVTVFHIKNEDNLKNEDQLKNEDDHKIEMK